MHVLFLTESIQNTLKTILIDGRRIGDKWYLQTGDEMAYLPWRDGQPTNRVNQTFLAMRKDANCKIKDLKDGFQANMTPVNTGFLCEYDWINFDRYAGILMRSNGNYTPPPKKKKKKKTLFHF